MRQSFVGWSVRGHLGRGLSEIRCVSFAGGGVAGFAMPSPTAYPNLEPTLRFTVCRVVACCPDCVVEDDILEDGDDCCGVTSAAWT